MKLKDIRAEIHYFSEKATEYNSKLTLAGIAIIWLFIFTKSTKDISITPLLAISLIAFLISVLIDLLYNTFAARIWLVKYKSHLSVLNEEEKRNLDELEREGPSNKVVWIVFYSKISCTVIGYCLLFVFLILKI